MRISSKLVEFFVAAIGVCVFRCGDLGCRTFLIFGERTRQGGIMENCEQDTEQPLDEERARALMKKISSAPKFKRFRRAMHFVAVTEARRMGVSLTVLAILPKSIHYKIGMNRVFREYGNDKRIPYPEVDTLYELVRSRLVKHFIMDRYIQHREERKQEK